jgi:hypothetical protein
MRVACRMFVMTGMLALFAPVFVAALHNPYGKPLNAQPIRIVGCSVKARPLACHR